MRTSCGTVGTADLRSRLEVFLRERLPFAENIELIGLRRQHGGLSRENWVVDLAWRDHAGARHEWPLIVRRDPDGSLLHTDRRAEFEALQALSRGPVPVPEVYWLDEDGSGLGAPSLIMQRVAGHCDWKVLNGERPLPDRMRLAETFLSLLTDLQAIDWRALGLDRRLNDPDDHAAHVELDAWEGELRRRQLEPLPEMDVVLGWLRARAPRSQGTVLVHGDWKPGNIMLADDEVSAVLDWETLHLGDPLEDLGWVTNPVRTGEHQIPGRWEREEIVAAYERRTGRRVLPADLHWWNVFSCWKLAVIVLTGLSEFVGQRLDRIHQPPTWLFRQMFAMTKDA